MKIFLLCLLIGSSVFFRTLLGQTGIQLNTEEALSSYTLIKISPFNDDIYLINNCGEIINYWKIADILIDLKLLNNGNLLYTTRIGNFKTSLHESNWNGYEIYTWAYDMDELLLTYDQIKLNNGNVLSVARKNVTKQEWGALGLDTVNFSIPDWSDWIIEINTQSGEIVWEWSVLDHVIQERDSQAANYGEVMANPGLINLDALPKESGAESFMLNGMDYNEELDQIVVSLRRISEIAIIDHSTTSEEASSHSGGDQGMGGDLLYRWGNPLNYNRGTEEDQFLFFQHNPNWIQYGEHKGKIICFNNGLERPGVDYSDIPVIDTHVDLNGSYSIGEATPHEPPIPDKVINENNEMEIFSGYTSSAVVLENENFHITLGDYGRIIEIDENDEMHWDYSIPFSGPYRTYKYPTDYPAFDGRDLTPSGKLPGDMSTYDCELFTVTTHSPEQVKYQVFVDETNTIHISIPEAKDYSVTLTDLSGKVLVQAQGTNQSHQIQGTNLADGVYFVRVELKSGDWGIAKVILMQ